jgi:hypothetical protein
LTNYLLSVDGEKLLLELSNQIVDAADSLGAESMKYLVDATRALAINDEVEAVRAFRALQSVLEKAQDGDVDQVQKGVAENLRGVLPEPTPSMKRFGRILSLLGSGQSDPAKFVPIVRKLSQEPRVQRAAGEIIARLGERVLSRSLRAAFGLPPPSFAGNGSGPSTVTEDIAA